MSVRTRMIHRTTIQRDATTTSDPWNNRDAADWQDHLSDVRCRGWVGTGGNEGEVVVDDDKTAAIEDRRAVVGPDVDVTVKDRLTNITTPAGEVVFDGPMRIDQVLQRLDHQELALEVID